MSKTINALAVIGAAYGDEGKGLITDHLATSDIIVVRSNGGAQAGHTVTTPDGRRHVFHHVGSGAFKGASTHLSRFFVAHPMFFAAERAELIAKGGSVEVTIDPRALVTTPYDILINQAVEKARGGGRHGSTGFGFGETVERSLDPAFSTAAGELSRSDLAMTLDRIRREWLPQRLLKLGVKSLDQEDAAALRSDAVLERFLDDVDAFRRTVGLRDDASLGSDGRQIQFEGAQGLMLDQDYGAFPYVTRSNTGLVNMAEIAREAGIEWIEATYVTRAYATRHGAGPLAREIETLDAVTVVDNTNITNEWQGSLRLAPLDLDLLAAAISHDVARGEASGVRIAPRAAVTCLDQIEGRTTVVIGGEAIKIAPSEFVRRICEATGIDDIIESRGPTRSTITRILQGKGLRLSEEDRQWLEDMQEGARRRRRKLFASRKVFSEAKFAEAIEVAAAEIEAMVQKGEVLQLTDEGETCYPRVQIGHDGRLLRHLPVVIEMMRSHWGAYDFLTTRHLGAKRTGRQLAGEKSPQRVSEVLASIAYGDFT